ncbi:MAG: GntR family transcriptional regulator [Thalassolituus sp.]|jgi:DNA-binding GntR family transcriptional regulator|uniref:GntR family transcriptional regulator n=1 Tax=Oceanospirillaceae TaxID=135620 RepID=UPI002EB832B4|nr:GntR family transcriptional regulator [Pseudomonadota bacterium]TNC86606.1 MAG: GntR family transcriptional regulator [Thalassolituus sp.]
MWYHPAHLTMTNDVMSFVAHESLAEKIAAHLSDRIIKGELVSGERIQEARVVEELQVSRGSVREALLLLESRHLVTILPRRGAMVAELTADRVNSLYDVYESLLTLLATQVALQWTEENKMPLLNQAMLLQVPDLREDKFRFMQAGFDLMRAACDVIDNPYLSTLLSDLQPAIQRTYALSIRFSQDGLDRSVAFFAKVVQLILARKTDDLIPVFRDFSQYQRSLVLRAMDESKASS